jgi:hypothetical protein
MNRQNLLKRGKRCGSVGKTIEHAQGSEAQGCETQGCEFDFKVYFSI